MAPAAVLSAKLYYKEVQLIVLVQVNRVGLLIKIRCRERHLELQDDRRGSSVAIGRGMSGRFERELVGIAGRQNDEQGRGVDCVRGCFAQGPAEVIVYGFNCDCPGRRPFCRRIRPDNQHIPRSAVRPGAEGVELDRGAFRWKPSSQGFSACEKSADGGQGDVTRPRRLIVTQEAELYFSLDVVSQDEEEVAVDSGEEAACVRGGDESGLFKLVFA